MKLIDKVRANLQELEPTVLEIEDISETHHGGNSETRAHFVITIKSDQFEGKNLVAQHKLVYNCIQEEMNTGIHALALNTSS